MIEDSALEGNVLSFREKSFSYDRSVRVGGEEFAVFQRTEVESETRFRPKVIRLLVAVPRRAVLGDLASETLVLAPDGRTPGPRRSGTAQEVAADEARFREQGLEFRRVARPDGSVVYVPTSTGDDLLGAL